jgi:hypothetical protein
VRREFAMDILETLQSWIGCMYISDLRLEAYKDRALELLNGITADSNQIAEAYSYITGGI